MVDYHDYGFLVYFDHSRRDHDEMLMVDQYVVHSYYIVVVHVSFLLAQHVNVCHYCIEN